MTKEEWNQEPGWEITLPKFLVVPKFTPQSLLFTIIIGGFLFNQFLMWKMSSSGTLNKLFSISISITRKNDK